MPDGAVVIYVELPEYQPFPSHTALAAAASPSLSPGQEHTKPPSQSEHCVLNDKDDAVAYLEECEHDPLVLIVNGPDVDLFETSLREHPGCERIVLSDLTIEQLSVGLNNREHQLLDHIIAHRAQTAWTINEMRITLQKLLKNDHFGLEKYLEPGTKISKFTVRGSVDREALNQSVFKFAETHKLGGYTSKMAFGICEEMLMNAIYDAPDAAGVQTYLDMPRSSNRDLAPEEFAELSYGCDGNAFIISIKDPFGAFTRPIFGKYIKKIVHRKDSENLIDTKKGGAGLGLFKIIYSSQSLICNVEKGKATEMIAIMDIHNQARDFSRMPRTLCFFQVR